MGSLPIKLMNQSFNGLRTWDVDQDHTQVYMYIITVHTGKHLVISMMHCQYFFVIVNYENCYLTSVD